MIISARIEEEISQLPLDEAEMFLTEMGLYEAGLDRLIRAGYQLLGLATYFTVGPKRGPRLDDHHWNVGTSSRRRHSWLCFEKLYSRHNRL